MMRRREGLLAASLALGGLPLALPACAAAPLRPLRPLLAADFRASGVRGVGYGLLRFGNRVEGDGDALVDLGASHVRLFIEAEREGTLEAYRIDPVQWSALDAVLESLERRSLYMVLVASFGPDARDSLWKSAALQKSAVQIWRQIAQRVRGRAGVAGFDIVNEPVPPGLTYAMRQDRWLELAGQVIEAVRAVDPGRVVIVESAPDATGESFANMRPLPFAGLVYSMHSYAPFEFTHQTVAAELTQPRHYPEVAASGTSSRQLLVESLEPVLRFARRNDVPIYVGEFSAPRWAPSGSTVRYIADSISCFHQYGWSWAYHEFRAWHGWDPEMAGMSREPERRRSDAPLMQLLRRAMREPRG